MVVAMLPSMAFAATTDVSANMSEVKVENGELKWAVGNLNGDTALDAKDEYTVKVYTNELGGPGDWVLKQATADDKDPQTSEKVVALADPTDGFFTYSVKDVLTATPVDVAVKAVITYKSGDFEGTKEVALKGTASTGVDVTGVTATLDASNLAKLTIVNPVENVKRATSYEVKLYKTHVAVTDAVTAIPADAELVDTLTFYPAANDTDGEVFELNAAKFTFDKAHPELAKNNYFVTVVAKRAGLKDSKLVFSAHKPYAEKKLAKVTKVTFDGKNVKFTNAENATKYVAQLYKTSDRSKVGEPVVGTDTDVKGYDFGKKVTVSANYYVGVVAKADGYMDSPEEFSGSHKVLAYKQLADIYASMDKDGKVTVVAGADQTASAIDGYGYKFVVYYKGNPVSKVHTMSLETAAKSQLGLAGWSKKEFAAGTPEVVVDKNDAKYNLGDFSLKIWAEATGKVNSKAVFASFGGALKAPTVVVWENNKIAPIAKWNAVEGATSYDVKLVGTGAKDADVTAFDVKGTSVDMTQYVPENLTDTDITFTVVAKNGALKSEAAASFAPAFYVNGKLEAAKNVKWDGNKCTWSPVAGAAYYTVSKMVNDKQVGPTKTVKTNEIQFKGLTKPGTYEFIVVAHSELEGYVASKAVKSDVKVVTAPVVGTPYITKASKTATTVKLRWTPAEDAQVYRIYYKTKGMDSYKIKVKEVRGDATAKTIKGLKKGTRYSFKIKAVNRGAAVYSNVKVVTTTK